MLYPTESFVKKAHQNIIESLGGESGILNESNLKSAVERPFTFTYGFEPFKDVVSKASALSYAIIAWHPFVDGNKRTAVFMLEDMLEANRYYIAVPPYIVKYTVQAALTEESPGFITEQEFTQRISKLCSKNKTAHLFKRIKYEVVPGLWLRWTIFIASRIWRTYKETIENPEKAPKFAFRFYSKFSRSDFFKLIFSRPIDWFAAGDLNIFTTSINEYKKMEEKGYPKEVPLLISMKDDYVEID